MSFITDVEYDECRKWIRVNRNKGMPWEAVYLAGEKDTADLETFLRFMVKKNNWPPMIDSEVWTQLVKAMEDAELKKIQMQNANRMAELHDGSLENNRIVVPEDDYSAWQLYKKHLKENKGFTDDAIQKIEDGSIGILRRLSINTVESGPVKGLVIGNVQSGKTANMAALMAMAADWRWNMFIVLSGTIENLRKQTQNRLFSDLNHHGNLAWIQLEHLSKKRSPVGQRLCDLQLRPDDHVRYMTVCLKVKSRLENLIEWIEADQQNMKNLRILVIDDEADQAGINTGNVYSEAERKTINRLIVNLVHCRDKKAVSRETNVFDGHYGAMNYVSYTATPYANCLNENGKESLYPWNFIRTLDISKSYLGPDKFFETADADHKKPMNIIRQIPEADVKKIKNLYDYGGGELPDSLKDAVCWFLCATGVMRYYGYKKPVSMLIHTSQKQDHHQVVAEAVKEWLITEKQDIELRCKTLYKDEKTKFTREEFRKVFPDYEHDDDEIWDYPEFEQIQGAVSELLGEITSIMLDGEGELHYSRGIHLCIDNCANNGSTDDGMYLRLAYPNNKNSEVPDFATAFIVIGGNTLSRGLTLEGLVSTFFLRSVRQADTLMQMGRWFGYRTHYELMQRVWLTDDTKRKFEFLADIDTDLREQIYQMALLGDKSPIDFQPAIKTSPKCNWLMLTGKKKMQMAQSAEVDFSGMDTQLTTYSKNADDQLKNNRACEHFIDALGNGYEESQNTKAYIWRNVPFDKISSEFFGKGFSVPVSSRAFQDIDLLTKWIHKQTEKGEMLSWTVMLSGVRITDQTPEDRVWHLGNGISIGKINRSCKHETENTINIGVLSGKKDYLADIKEEMLPPEKWKEMIARQTIGNDYINYRNAAGLSGVPLLIIYNIYRYSTAADDAKERKDLNADNDLIGVTMVTPGIRSGRVSTVTRLKIKSPEIDQEAEIPE